MDKENVHMHNEGTMHNSNNWKYGGIGGWGSAYGQSAWYTCIKMFLFLSCTMSTTSKISYEIWEKNLKDF